MAITKCRLKGNHRHIHYTRYTKFVEAVDQFNGTARYVAYVTDANIWYVYRIKSPIVFKTTTYRIQENNTISFFAFFDLEGDTQQVKAEIIETLIKCDQFIDNDGTGSNQAITQLKKENPFRFSSVGDRHRPKPLSGNAPAPLYELTAKGMSRLLADYQRQADKITETVLERARKEIAHEQEQLRNKLLTMIKTC